ncbi:LD-carboxypeptidase [Sphingomonas koreensis]|nr:LD-carboxypeptidase [Sphingomonas koreensis]
MRIGVVAPARELDRGTAAKAEAFVAIAFPSVDLVVHPQCFLSDGHFAGSDENRAAAFLEFANDPAIDAIWFGRGGYGSNRLLELVMPELGPAARDKAYLGYSDCGFLLGALYARRIGRPVHGPMVIDINRAGGDVTVTRALAWLTAQARQGLEPDLAGRPAAAFNLAILTSMIGTSWLPDLTDHVLMIEEVSEPLYRIDRMLFQLAHATQLKGIAGVRLGAIRDVQLNDPPFGESPEEMIVRWCGEMGVPYLGRAAIGHDADNCVVPFGVA